jgi:indole-3-glycerol phosphate synthase
MRLVLAEFRFALTDGKYFGGSLDDLPLARVSVNIPLLRKEL